MRVGRISYASFEIFGNVAEVNIVELAKLIANDVSSFNAGSFKELVGLPLNGLIDMDGR